MPSHALPCLRMPSHAFTCSQVQGDRGREACRGGGGAARAEGDARPPRREHGQGASLLEIASDCFWLLLIANTAKVHDELTHDLPNSPMISRDLPRYPMCWKVRDELQGHVRQCQFMIADVVRLLLDDEAQHEPTMDIMQWHKAMKSSFRFIGTPYASGGHVAHARKYARTAAAALCSRRHCPPSLPIASLRVPMHDRPLASRLQPSPPYVYPSRLGASRRRDLCAVAVQVGAR